MKQMDHLSSDTGDTVSGSDEYVSIAEVGKRLGLKPKRIRNMMALGIFQEGKHFFRRPGIRPRFRWSAVVAWLECPQDEPCEVIPMARGRRIALAAAPTI